MGMSWHKVWFDLWSNKMRTLLAVLSIAAGGFAIGTVFGMVDQFLSSLDQAHQAIVPAHIAMTLNYYKPLLLASLIPARSATRISVRESLSYQ